jgi:hypothetical protein
VHSTTQLFGEQRQGIDSLGDPLNESKHVNRDLIDRRREPCLPGYTGYISQFKGASGNTYGKTTQELHKYDKKLEPQRQYQTMSISNAGCNTIRNEWTETMSPRKVIDPQNETNKLTDIISGLPGQGVSTFSGAHKSRQYVNKPDYKARPITGSTSMRLHPEARPNKPLDSNIDASDIAGTKPNDMRTIDNRQYTFKTQRHVDPLRPAYNTSTYEAAASARNGEWVVPGGFGRETNKLDDIKDSGPRRLIPEHEKTLAPASRSGHAPQNASLNNSDIEGTQVGWRVRNERARAEGHPMDSLKVDDINYPSTPGWTGERYATQRVVCPLDPSYSINGMTHKDDGANKSRPLTFIRKEGDPHTLSLVNSDIEGTWPGWQPRHLNGGIPDSARRHWKKTNYIEDVQGAHSDFRYMTQRPVRGIRTDRVVDPNTGAGYTDLDGDVLIDTGRVHLTPDAGMTRHRSLQDMGASVDGGLSGRGPGGLVNPWSARGAAADGGPRLFGVGQRTVMSRGAQLGRSRERATQGGSVMGSRAGMGESSGGGGGGGARPASGTESEKDLYIASLKGELTRLRTGGGGGGGGGEGGRAGLRSSRSAAALAGGREGGGRYSSGVLNGFHSSVSFVEQKRMDEQQQQQQEQQQQQQQQQQSQQQQQGAQRLPSSGSQRSLQRSAGGGGSSARQQGQRLQSSVPQLRMAATLKRQSASRADDIASVRDL